MTGALDEAGIDGVGHANVSTAVQQAQTEEGKWICGRHPRVPNVSMFHVKHLQAVVEGWIQNSGMRTSRTRRPWHCGKRYREQPWRLESMFHVKQSCQLPMLAHELGDEPSIDRESAARSARFTFRIDRDALNGDRRVMAVANQKGGVGKSTTAVNIGAYLALAGARVLVIDLDPQGNASTGLGLDHREIEPSIYDVLTGEAAPAAAIRPTGVANLYVLPSTIDLAGAEVELVRRCRRDTAAPGA